VIVRDKGILATGYNGSLRGLPHCTEVGCLIENGHCVRTVHAEANAILQAAKPRRADRGRRHLRHRLAVLELFQAGRQRRPPARPLRRVLPRRADHRVRRGGGIELVFLGLEDRRDEPGRRGAGA